MVTITVKTMLKIWCEWLIWPVTMAKAKSQKKDNWLGSLICFACLASIVAISFAFSFSGSIYESNLLKASQSIVHSLIMVATLVLSCVGSTLVCKEFTSYRPDAMAWASIFTAFACSCASLPMMKLSIPFAQIVFAIIIICVALKTFVWWNDHKKFSMYKKADIDSSHLAKPSRRMHSQSLLNMKSYIHGDPDNKSMGQITPAAMLLRQIGFKQFATIEEKLGIEVKGSHSLASLEEQTRLAEHNLEKTSLKSAQNLEALTYKRSMKAFNMGHDWASCITATMVHNVMSSEGNAPYYPEKCFAYIAFANGMTGNSQAVHKFEEMTEAYKDKGGYWTAYLGLNDPIAFRGIGKYAKPFFYDGWLGYAYAWNNAAKVVADEHIALIIEAVESKYGVSIPATHGAFSDDETAQWSKALVAISKAEGEEFAKKIADCIMLFKACDNAAIFNVPACVTQDGIVKCVDNATAEVYPESFIHNQDISIVYERSEIDEQEKAQA